MSEAPETWLTTDEAIKYLKISRRYLYDLIYARKIAFHRLTKPSGKPGEYRFKREDLDAYMAAQQQPAIAQS